MNANTPIRKYEELAEQSTENALAHELPYWDFLGEVVVLADGTQACGYKLQGLATETLDTSHLNRLTEGLRAALNSLPDEFEFTFIHDVRPSYQALLEKHAALCPEQEDLRWLTQVRIDKLCAESHSDQLLKPELYLIVYKRLTQAMLARAKSFFSAPQRFVEYGKQRHEATARELRQVAQTLCDTLNATGIASVKMDRNEVLALIYRFLNPKRSKDLPAPTLNTAYRGQEFEPEELAKAKSLALPSPREQLAFSDLICRADCLQLDGIFQRCITLKTLPEFTHAALVSKLTALPFPFSLQVHIRVPEQSKELSSLQARRRMAHSMSASTNGRVSDLESEARLNSTEEVLRELINTGQKLFYFQCVVLIDAVTEEELNLKSRMVLARLRELNGAEGMAESIGNLKVWKSLLPFGNTGLVRSKRIKSDNLADFLSVYQPYEGTANKPVCLFKNRSMGLVSYDPFDAKLPNYNSLVTGSSGAGKSFVNNLILLQYMTQKPLVYIIDVGGSYRKLCEYFGGQYIEMVPPDKDGRCSPLNPFALAEGEIEPSSQKVKFLLAFLENVITDESQKRLSKLERSLIEEAILSLYVEVRRREDRAPTLSDLRLWFESSSHEVLRSYAKILYSWTGDRPYGRLLDSESAIRLDKEFVVFDLKGLSNYPDLQSVMLLIITDFILGRVEKVKGRPKQIFMDECWEVLKNPASLHVMEYCVRTLRKMESGITFITQGLEEIVASPIGSAILSNTATKIILLQRGDLRPVRDALKLNDQEISLISSLRRSKGNYSEAFLVHNEDRAVIRIEPTSVEYWLATSDGGDNRTIDARRAAKPDAPLSQIIYELAKGAPEENVGVR